MHSSPVEIEPEGRFPAILARLGAVRPLDARTPLKMQWRRACDQHARRLADLKATSNDMKQFPQNKRAPRLWGATQSEPTTVEEWRANFAAWLHALDWFLKHSERSETDAKHARKTAPLASLLHAPKPESVSEEERDALWQLRGAFDGDRNRPLDFGDAYTLWFWRDFLNEHRTRRSSWRQFEKQHGQRAAL